MGIERVINVGYTEHSPQQIESIKARYEAGLMYSKKLLGEVKGPWLDIGSNIGYGLQQLSPHKKGFFAIDIEKKYLQEALKRNSYVEGAVMDGCCLGFPDNCFMIVSCFEVIEHMGEAKQGKLLAEIKRVLKPSGVLIISTPNKIASGKRRMSPDHEKELTFQELNQLLIERGFAINEVLGEGFFNNNLPHRVFRNLRENPLAILAYYRLLPWFLRSRLRDAFFNSQDGTEVRRPKPKETSKLMFVVCQQSEN